MTVASLVDGTAVRPAISSINQPKSRTQAHFMRTGKQLAVCVEVLFIG